MASRLFFNGQLWSTPTTLSTVDDSAMAPTNLTVGNTLLLIGKASSGQPNTALRFGSPGEVVAALSDGELCDAAVKAFNASNETNAANTVIALRVGAATQATKVLVDGSAAPVINLASDDYGINANLIKVKVETGSIKGKKLTTQHGNRYFSGDNIARDALTITYSGAAAVATVTVTINTLVLIADASTVTIDLTTTPTVAHLVEQIVVVPGFTATAAAGSADTPTLNALDFVSATSVKVTPLTVTANLQACIDWFNGLSELYLTATRPATGAGAVPVNSAFAFLTGGTNPTITNTDWSNAFTAAQLIDAQWIVPLTGDASIHAMADAHCQFMSNLARKERRAFVGPAAGTSLAAVQLLPKAIDSDRTAMVWPGHYDYDANGVLVLRPPYMTAAIVAAAFAGLNPGTPMTNKTLTVRGLEFTIRNPTDTDLLIQAGVLAVEDTSAGYKVVRSITTWLENNNFNRVEVSTGVAVDYTARSVRDAIDVLRGQKITPLLLARAASLADSTLRLLSQPEPQGIGVLAGDTTNPAYKGVVATINGDAIQVEFQASPVIPCNFITITIHAVPYTGSAKLTSHGVV